MASDVYWIEQSCLPRMGIMARPRAGEWLSDEVTHWRREGIQQVVSLLEPVEVKELGLEDEPEVCEKQGILFRSFPIPDRGIPKDTRAVVDLAKGILRDGRVVAIHCRAGIGRSTLVAASTLVVAGIAPETALALIATARHVPVPDTDEQRAWILEFGQYLAV